MKPVESDKRNSGLSLVGDLPWGTHFCQFYQTKDDLLDILVPYIRAGLDNNEFCLWVTSGPVRSEDARRVMKKAVPNFTQHMEAGQVEIITYNEWSAAGREPGKALVGMLDSAITRGFDGLRLACCSMPDKGSRLARDMADADAISADNAVGLFAYPRARFDAVGLMEVVKNHRFALVRNADRWEVIESSEAKKARDALRKSEQLYHSLFDNMLDGYAYCRMIFRDGRPEDFVYIAVNGAFEKLTGLKDVVGKRVTEVIPGIKESNPELFEVYGRVAVSGQPERFDVHVEPLGIWLSISVYSPAKGAFTAVFDNITERKRAEEAILRKSAVLDAINRVFRESLTRDTEEDLATFCLSVVQDLTRSKFGFIGEMGPDGLLHDTAMSDTGWKLCTMYDKTGHRRPPGDFGLHGLYGRVLIDGKSLLSNNPSSHPDSIGTPPGHPPITAFLGTPLILDRKVIGMLGLANREGGYRSEDLEAAEALAPAIVEAMARKKTEEELKRRTAELEAANKELESFSYTVSHDLRAPLRTMDGYSQVLLEDYADRLDESGKGFLQTIRRSSQLMAQLINDILGLSRVIRAELNEEHVNLSDAAWAVADRLRSSEPQRRVRFNIAPGLVSWGDANLLGLVLENLLGNAFKFTARHQYARIELGTCRRDGQTVYYVRDNGVGFDMAYVDKIFKPFQRLHSDREFPGTGIGLATVQRVISRHGGTVWAEAEVEKGCTVYFTLSQEKQ